MTGWIGTKRGRRAGMIDPLKQAILTQIFIETIPDAVNYRYRLIKNGGYKKYRRKVEKMIEGLVILAQRDQKTMEEYGLDWIYSIFQSKFCKNSQHDYCKKGLYLLVYLEEREYFENEGQDPMRLEIATESLSRGEVPDNDG